MFRKFLRSQPANPPLPSPQTFHTCLWYMNPFAMLEISQIPVPKVAIPREADVALNSRSPNFIIHLDLVSTPKDQENVERNVVERTLPPANLSLHRTPQKLSCPHLTFSHSNTSEFGRLISYLELENPVQLGCIHTTNHLFAQISCDSLRLELQRGDRGISKAQ